MWRLVLNEVEKLKKINILIFFVLSIFLSNTILLAQSTFDLSEIKQLYENAQFEEALKRMENIDHLTLNLQNRKAFYLYNSMCDIALGNNQLAEENFRKLIIHFPNFILTSDIASPNVVRMFSRIRSDIPIVTGMEINNFYPYKERCVIKVHMTKISPFRLVVNKQGQELITKYHQESNMVFGDGKDKNGQFLMPGAYTFSFITKHLGEEIKRNFTVSISHSAPYGVQLHGIEESSYYYTVAMGALWGGLGLLSGKGDVMLTMGGLAAIMGFIGYDLPHNIKVAINNKKARQYNERVKNTFYMKFKIHT